MAPTTRSGDASAAEVQAAPAPTSGFARHVKCPVFKGTASEDAAAWLKQYSKYCDFFHLDDSFRLANVEYFLSGGAKRWWSNTEDSCQTFDMFKEQFALAYMNDV